MPFNTDFPTQIEITLGSAYKPTQDPPYTLTESDVLVLSIALSSAGSRIFTEDGTLTSNISSNRISVDLALNDSDLSAIISMVKTSNATNTFFTEAINFALTSDATYTFKDIFNANPTASIQASFASQFDSTSTVPYQNIFSTLEVYPSNGGGGLTDRQRRLYWLGYT